MTLLDDVKATLRAARFDRAEVSGSLGDLGTFLPLLVAMSAVNGLDFGTSLLFAGLFNIATGMMFRIPMAVQPMKAIAAVAITQGLTFGQITAAGAMVSAGVMILALAGGLDLIHRIIPSAVVRGMQLALGLTLMMKGVALAASGQVWWGPDSIAVAAGAAMLVVFTLGLGRFPVALILFAAGVALAAWRDPTALGALGAGPWLPHWSPPALSDLRGALVDAALPQLPLTTLNSVVAVCALSTILFPHAPASPRKVAVSVGMMNLIGVWFGAMPMCHGAGGLAGQHRFGARTNGSILMLGGAKVLLALVLGGTLLPLCAAFPGAILGVMLVVSGAELASAALRAHESRSTIVFVCTAGLCLALDHIAIGVGIGLVVSWIVRLQGSDRPAQDRSS